VKTLTAAHRDLAIHLQASFDANERRLDLLGLLFRLSLVLLVAETILWIIGLRGV
jgi:hypothetical protein